MDPESSAVVSDSTEQTVATTEAASTASTQTEDTTDPTPRTEQEKRDYRKLQKEDADLNAHVQREIQKALQKHERRQLKQTAKVAADQGDSVAALSIAQRIAAEPDESDDEDSTPNTAEWRAKADKIQPQLDLLLELDDKGQATNPYYVKVFEKYGQKDLDKRYAADPIQFTRWLNNELTEMRVDDMLRKKAPSLYEAGKLDGQNTALQGAPKPLNGTAAGGVRKWTPEAVAKLSSAEYRQHRDKIIADLYS